MKALFASLLLSSCALTPDLMIHESHSDNGAAVGVSWRSLEGEKAFILGLSREKGVTLTHETYPETYEPWRDNAWKK